MRHRLKIIISLLYAVIFLVFAGTGALVTQAGDRPEGHMDGIFTMEVVEEVFFTDLACYGNYRDMRQSH